MVVSIVYDDEDVANLGQSAVETRLLVYGYGDNHAQVLPNVSSFLLANIVRLLYPDVISITSVHRLLDTPG